ncbi:MAG: hypothetical protein AB7V18_14960 [Pyrinomonadaceae bacterium]
MHSELSVRYIIDANDNISFVDDGWCRFAEENDGADLMPAIILGQSIWDHITDVTTTSLYQQIVSQVRQGKSSRFVLRCDSPDCRRLLELTISPAPNGSVEFVTQPLDLEGREPIPILSHSMPRSDDLIRACSWCNRIDAGSGFSEWVEVEEAMNRLRLFELEQMPQLTHGICESCYAKMTKKVALIA